MTTFPDIDECEKDVCFNNGTCKNTNGGYVCDCTKNFQGKNCLEGTNII